MDRTLRGIENTGSAGYRRTPRRLHRELYSAFLRSPITGWTVAIGVPRDVIDGPLHRAYQLALGAGMAVLALSLGLAWWMARTIRRPVDALTAAARTMGSGGHPGLLVSGVREIDQVAEALSR